MIDTSWNGTLFARIRKTNSHVGNNIISKEVILCIAKSKIALWMPTAHSLENCILILLVPGKRNFSSVIFWYSGNKCQSEPDFIKKYSTNLK